MNLVYLIVKFRNLLFFMVHFEEIINIKKSLTFKIKFINLFIFKNQSFYKKNVYIFILPIK